MASTPVSVNFPANLPADATVWESKVASFVQAAERRRAHYLRLAHRVTPCQQEAEDIVQEALLRAFRNLQHFRGEAQMTTWLQTIVQNAAREWLRERRGVRLVSLEREDDAETVTLDFPDPGRTPEKHFEHTEMRQILLTEIGNLSSACQQALRMCALEGASQEEAANALEVSVAAIKARVFSARRRLRESLELRGIRREN
jgi:RNA polymerase sigma factor (sigma-70 family)